MIIQYLTDPLKIGTMVRVRTSRMGPARVIEYRGPLGPNGARIYGLQLSNDAYTEVREDQIEIVPTDSLAAPEKTP